ncbi:MAG TPA: hypothetical protein VJA19_17520 [Pseudomonas sp.]|nr:hypothetical protein [Pseudomonas sp.]
MQSLVELAEVQEFQAQLLREQAQYQHGLECLIGFLLDQVRACPGWSAAQLLEALEDEQLGQLERQPDTPLLLPFERLALQLHSLSGRPVVETYLPKALQCRYPRLDPTPPRLRPVSGTVEHDE